jgi:outer membrane lipoprotein-sorting protein
MNSHLKIAAVILLATLTTTAGADNTKGLEIAQERKARDVGWQDSVADMSMVLNNAQGETSSRKIRIKTLEVENDGDKGLTIFDEPFDVKGTAFLNFAHTSKADDQWIYLPALKRVKRIGSRNKSGPFMGSEFAYEDLSSFEVEKYSFNYLGDESIDGVDMFKLEQVPTDKYSGYTKQVVWLDHQEYRPYKVEFYDRKNSLLKTLSLSNYEHYLSKYWRAHQLVMTNHQTGKLTTLTTHELRFQTGLSDKDFSKSSLKRAH